MHESSSNRSPLSFERKSHEPLAIPPSPLQPQATCLSRFQPLSRSFLQRPNQASSSLQTEKTSPSHLAPFLAALAPGVNIIRMLLLGLGIWRNEAMVMSMSREGDYRELLKGPLYYACTITLSTLLFWRTSPIAIAAICNLCAGDGIADIVGRRFGKKKLPYNPSKSFAGTISMAVAGFLTSIGYMHYFASFGFLEESWSMILGFLVVSVAAAVVESTPISSEVDDNLTVPLASLLVGAVVL